MSRIDELIAELCPEGVEFRALGEVAPYTATRIDAQDLDDSNFVGVDNLLPNKAGRVDATHRPNTDRLARFEMGDVLLGNIRPYLKKVWLSDRAGGCSGDVLVLRIADSCRERLLPKFLYYVVSSDDFFAFNMQHAKGAKMPRGDKAAILRYRIPLPPMAIQREIASILDKMENLKIELEAELEARSRQYAFYRETCLERGSAKGVRLGDFARVAMCKRVFKSETQPVGEVPFFKIGTFGGEPDCFISQELFDDYRARFAYPKPGSVLISAAGTIGRTVVFDGAPAYFQDSNIVWLEHDRSVVLDDYLKHWYRTIPWASTAGGTIKRLYNEDLLRTRILVPSIEEQHRIVDILDKFDTLVNDLSSGLPAEIAARRKQYEYYRDKLLTFPEKAAV